MRFLVDECIGPAVANWLRSQSHEVYDVYMESPGIEDGALLSTAERENWILITSDKEFGEKVFRENRAHRGIILLRLADERAASKIAVMDKLLRIYADRIADRFVVATESRVRFAGR